MDSLVEVIVNFMSCLHNTTSRASEVDLNVLCLFLNLQILHNKGGQEEDERDNEPRGMIIPMAASL